MANPTTDERRPVGTAADVPAHDNPALYTGQPAPPHTIGIASAPPKRSPYPKGSTDNRLLMEAAHRLAPGPFKLFTMLLVRMAGKGVCWPSTACLMADLGDKSVRNVKRWRAELIDKGFITTTRKGRKGGGLTYRLVTGPVVQPVSPTGSAKSVPTGSAKSVPRKTPMGSGPILQPLERPPGRAPEPEGPDVPPTATAKQFGAAILRDWRSRTDPNYGLTRDDHERGLRRALEEREHHQEALDACTEAIRAHRGELIQFYSKDPPANSRPPDDPA